MTFLPSFADIHSLIKPLCMRIATILFKNSNISLRVLSSKEFTLLRIVSDTKTVVMISYQSKLLQILYCQCNYVIYCPVVFCQLSHYFRFIVRICCIFKFWKPICRIYLTDGKINSKKKSTFRSYL